MRVIRGPTASLRRWEEGIYAGRDTLGGGTWLGVHENGKVALLTNYREKNTQSSGNVSRGTLLWQYLSEKCAASHFLESIQREAAHMAGFSIVVLDSRGLYYYNNRSREIVRLSKGVYGLSNAFLDTAWPKLVQGKSEFQKQLHRTPLRAAPFLSIMEDKHLASDDLLPSTGLSYEKERAYSARFIETLSYGTRTTTYLSISYKGHTQIVEKTHATPFQVSRIQDLKFYIHQNIYS